MTSFPFFPFFSSFLLRDVYGCVDSKHMVYTKYLPAVYADYHCDHGRFGPYNWQYETIQTLGWWVCEIYKIAFLEVIEKIIPHSSN